VISSKADLLREGCQSLNKIGPAPGTDTGYQAFFDQCPHCMFSMGACHIFAVALHRRLDPKIPGLFVFHLYHGDCELVHVVTGKVGGPYLDANLRWMSIGGLELFWGRGGLFPSTPIDISAWPEPEKGVAHYSQIPDDPPSLCSATEFILIGRTIAERFLEQNADNLERLLIKDG
jgi:hypothetical protein